MIHINLETTPEELFLMIGEREFTVFKLRQEIERLQEENRELRRVLGVDNGELVKPDSNN